MTDQHNTDDDVVNGEVVDNPAAGHDLAVADDVLPDTLHVMPISSRWWSTSSAGRVRWRL